MVKEVVGTFGSSFFVLIAIVFSSRLALNREILSLSLSVDG